MHFVSAPRDPIAVVATPTNIYQQQGNRSTLLVNLPSGSSAPPSAIRCVTGGGDAPDVTDVVVLRGHELLWWIASQPFSLQRLGNVTAGAPSRSLRGLLMGSNENVAIVADTMNNCLRIVWKNMTHEEAAVGECNNSLAQRVDGFGALAQLVRPWALGGTNFGSVLLVESSGFIRSVNLRQKCVHTITNSGLLSAPESLHVVDDPYDLALYHVVVDRDVFTVNLLHRNITWIASLDTTANVLGAATNNRRLSFSLFVREVGIVSQRTLLL